MFGRDADPFEERIGNPKTQRFVIGGMVLVPVPMMSVANVVHLRRFMRGAAMYGVPEFWGELTPY